LFLCPRCAVALKSSASPHGRFLRCDACEGRACTVTFLRKSVDRDQVNRVWRAIYEQSHSAVRNCPSCEKAMREVTIGLQSRTVQLDGCRSCQLIWFDDTEIERFSPRPMSGRQERELPLVAREAIARVELA